MKRAVFLSLAISLVLLSACNSDSPAAEETESYTIGSYQLSMSESLANEGSANQAESETTVHEEAEADPTETASVPLNALYRFVDMDFSLIPLLVSDELICVPRNSNAGEPMLKYQYDLDFIDINENKTVNTVSLPKGFFPDHIFAGSGNVLARIYSETFDSEMQDYLISAAIIYDDFSFDIVDNPTARDFYFEHYGHKISKWDIDLVCVDDEPEVIVPGYRKENDEYGFYTEFQMYMFPIDENRFVYRTGGYERLPGFGIYDFRTKTASNVPDSTDLIPIGVHDGKIYSVKSAWDGFGSELYITDIETLETSFFMDFPYKLELNDHVNYYMPESGEYILAFRNGYEITSVIYMIDPDTGEITKTYDDVPQNFDFYGSGFFIDENRIAFVGTSDREDKLLVFAHQN